MTLEMGGGVFLKFPVRNSAVRASPNKPFVSQPSACPAVDGVADQKCLAAMGGHPGYLTFSFNGSDTVKLPVPRRPQLYFLNQVEQPDPFSKISFLYGRLVFIQCFNHDTIRFFSLAESSGVAPGCMDLESM